MVGKNNRITDLRGRFEKSEISVTNGKEYGDCYVTKVGEQIPFFEVTASETFGMSPEEKIRYIVSKYEVRSS